MSTYHAYGCHVHYFNVGAFGSTERAELNAWAAKTRVIGLDVESKAIDDSPMFWSDKEFVRSVQFGYGDTAYFLNLADPSQREAVRDVLSIPHLWFVAHGDIDARAIAGTYGMDITPRYLDSLTIALLLEPGNQVPHGLKPLTARHLDGGLSKAEEAKDAYFRAHKVNWTTVPITAEPYVVYGGLDAIYVARLWPVLIEETKRKGVYEAVRQEVWCRQAMTRVSIRGWRLDRGYVERTLEDVGGRHHAARERIVDLMGMPAGSPRRAPWLAERGVEFTRFTKKGSPTLAGEAVHELQAKYNDHGEVTEALNLIAEAASTQNATTFMSGLLSRMDGGDRVHSEIRTLGAVSGRMSVTEPASQTVKGPSRGAFLPDSDDHVLVSVDYAQVEPRIAVARAQEAALMDKLRVPGNDAYSETAKMVFGPNFTKRERTATKRIFLATLYGAGIATIQTQLLMLDGIHAEQEELMAARQLFRSQTPSITARARELQNAPHVKLDSGRIIPQDPERLYKALNSDTQGTARDRLVDDLKRLEDAGFGPNILMPIHDEVMFSLPRKNLREQVAEIERCMGSDQWGMKFFTDAEVYPERWGAGMVPIDKWQD